MYYLSNTTSSNINIASNKIAIPKSKPKILLRDLSFLCASSASGVRFSNSLSFFSVNIINT